MQNIVAPRLSQRHEVSRSIQQAHPSLAALLPAAGCDLLDDHDRGGIVSLNVLPRDLPSVSDPVPSFVSATLTSTYGPDTGDFCRRTKPPLTTG